MAKILNLETSSYVCSVAISENSEVVDFRETSEDKTHASMLTVLINGLLEKNNLKINDMDAIAVSKGPGSYTGLRIGVSVAKGICYGSNLPLISVCSLHSMAKGILQNIEFKKETEGCDNYILCPMIDARRMELYTALFTSNVLQISEIEAKIVDGYTFSDILQNKKVIFFGNGAEKCKQLINDNNAIFIDSFHPSARYMTEISENCLNKRMFENTAYFEPFYLKDFIPTTPKNKFI